MTCSSLEPYAIFADDLNCDILLQSVVAGFLRRESVVMR
jgi:hypothetical protein